MSGVTIISRHDAMKYMAQSLGLPDAVASLEATNNALVAQSLRRSVYVAAPCGTRVARTLVTTALAPLAEGTDDFDARVSETLDDLIATGDLLEMRSETADGVELVLRPAPPAFIKRNDGMFILLGVAGDEITPHFDQTVTYRLSGLRTLMAEDSAACAASMLEMGLIELSSSFWLYAPTPCDAESFRDLWLAQLQSSSLEKLDDLEILDTATPTTFYKDRWRPLRNKDTGFFLARREKRYGAKLWCLVEVQGGFVQKLVDVHSKDARIRDCDEGWRIQAAFDALAGAPQKVDVALKGDNALLSFYSPIPAWAIRRLSLIGERVKPARALLGFEIPRQNMDDEIRWLGETLWLAHNHEGAE